MAKEKTAAITTAPSGTGAQSGTPSTPKPQSGKGKGSDVKPVKKVTAQERRGTERRKAKAPKRSVPAPGTIKKLTKVTTIASELVASNPDIDEQIAITNLKAIAKITGTQLKNDGKLSPLGHMAGKQNGEFDVAILTTSSVDFSSWVIAVAKAGCTSRRTALTDNEGFTKRLQSHLRFVSGRKTQQKRNDLKRRLTKVGLAERIDEITKLFVPVSELFDKHVEACKF